MIVTIDGPAGAGKSSVARALAARLGFHFLDTGAMFRAVALAALRAGAALEDDQALASVVASLHLEMRASGEVVLNGEEVTEAIRAPEISQGASRVAASGAVRPRLAEMQRDIARGRRIVTEGRDQGTAVFPDAGCKFYLDAAPEERLRRRAAQLQRQGKQADLESLRREQAERDARDRSRHLAPLRAAADAVVIDSTGLTAAEVTDLMEAEVRRRLGAS